MPLFPSLTVLGALMMSSGCGLLGNKTLPSAGTSGVGNNGCLNDSRDLVGRYVDGKISQTEWKAAFSCINQSLGFFTDYVRGSSQDAYSPGDMYNLVKGFLITKNTVNPDLLISAFSLKSALFGGTDKEFTKDEIELLKSSLDRLEAITSELIPQLAIRQKANPTPAELLELVDSFKRAGDQLSDFINTLPVGFLSNQALTTLITEISQSLDLPIIDGLSDKLFLTKWIMFNTRRDAIENKDWANLFKSAMGVGGIALAFKASIGSDPTAPEAQIGNRLMNDSEFRSFTLELINQLKPYFEASLSNHNGLTPIPLFDHLIDALPDTILNGIPKKALKSAIRPLLRKILFSSTQAGVDQAVIDTAYTLIQSLVSDLNALDRFYEKTGIDLESVSPQSFSQALENYYSSLNNSGEKIQFKSIKTKLLTYKPLFRKRSSPNGETHTIQYGQGIGYSHFQNALVLSIDQIGRHIMKAYASNRDYLVDSDLTAFFKDFSDVLFALKIVDTTVPNFGPKRLQDMDLFTEASNGNAQGSIEELVNYAMILISSGSIIDRMRAEITATCDQGLGEDIMGWTLIPANCFRSQFNDRLEYWISEDFPRLTSYWRTLSAGDRKKAMMWLEHGSRRNGYTQEDFGKFDIGAMAVILYYTESLFNRFDFDINETLSRSEVNSAYPVFKGLIKKTASEKGLNTSSDFLLKGIFTYIVRYQEMPITPPSVSSVARLAWWMATYSIPTTDYHTNRYGIFNIVCQIAAPENPNQAPANATVCAP
jgi:hypothetical protein